MDEIEPEIREAMKTSGMTFREPFTLEAAPKKLVEWLPKISTNVTAFADWGKGFRGLPSKKQDKHLAKLERNPDPIGLLCSVVARCKALLERKAFSAGDRS